jgi:hypothetical protein
MLEDGEYEILCGWLRRGYQFKYGVHYVDNIASVVNVIRVPYLHDLLTSQLLEVHLLLLGTLPLLHSAPTAVLAFCFAIECGVNFSRYGDFFYLGCAICKICLVDLRIPLVAT